MNDFSKILDKAKELENKMKESQKKIKSIEATGISGGGEVKVTLNGENEIVSIDISKTTLSSVADNLYGQPAWTLRIPPFLSTLDFEGYLLGLWR